MPENVLDVAMTFLKDTFFSDGKYNVSFKDLDLGSIHSPALASYLYLIGLTLVSFGFCLGYCVLLLSQKTFFSIE